MTRYLKIANDLNLPLDAVTSTIVVYGGKGMGKTNLGSVICEEVAAARQRFSALDPMGVMWGLRYGEDGKGPGIEVLILGGRRGDIPIEPTAGAVVADLVVNESVNVVIDISRRADGKMWTKGEKIRFVADYMTRLYERQGESMRPLMQIVDEAARFVPQIIPHGSPELSRCVGAIEQLVEEGRNVGVGVCLITQRSARMNKSVSELADCMIAFRTIGPNSVAAILDWFGEHVAKERWKSLIEQLRVLERGTALVVSPGWLRFEGTVAFRARRTFDSSPTPTGKERKTSGAGARVDLTAYVERMRATIEKAKADDPRELRKKIAELELQIKTQPTKAVSAAVAEKWDKVVKSLQAQLAEKEASEQEMSRQVKAMTTTVQSMIGDLSDIRKSVELAEDTASASVKKATIHAEVVKQKRVATVEPTREVLDELVDRHTVDTHESLRLDRNGQHRLKKGAREMLVALAASKRGLSRSQMATLVGIKVQGSTFSAYMSSLRVYGYLQEDADGTVYASNEGMQVAKRLNPGLRPATPDELKALWMGKLKKGARQILELLLSAYPKQVRRSTIAEATAIAESGSTFSAYVSTLFSNGLVTKHDDSLRASDTFFLEDA